MIISETFHGKISLNSVVLLLILDFVSGYRLEYPSSSEVSDQARLISMVFSCCHSSLESFFFHLYQQNKFSESKVKVQTGFFAKGFLKLPNLHMLIKQKSP